MDWKEYVLMTIGPGVMAVLFFLFKKDSNATTKTLDTMQTDFKEMLKLVYELNGKVTLVHDQAMKIPKMQTDLDRYYQMLQERKREFEVFLSLQRDRHELSKDK